MPFPATFVVFIGKHLNSYNRQTATVSGYLGWAKMRKKTVVTHVIQDWKQLTQYVINFSKFTDIGR